MEYDVGATAWVLASAALVLFMTPGLAFFYGGMVRSKNVLSMLMLNFVCIGVVSLLWVVVGYSLAFGDDVGRGLLGFDAGLLGLRAAEGVEPAEAGSGIPPILFVAFQMMFAILTPALISGALADRVKFGGWVLFVALWHLVVYAPVAHWVFDFGDGVFNDGDTGAGWIVGIGALDFAGGTAVHINAGAAALACILVLGKRRGFGREQMRPHNLPLVLLGAGILWFGWFGFNAGSALAANGTAAQAFLNTQVAAAAGAVAWIGVEKLRDGHATTLGIASGAIAGLVAITPAAGAVDSLGAIVVGLLGGGAAVFAVGLKHRLGYDDALDVIGVHLVAGLVGTLAIGLFANAEITGEAAGLLYGGGLGLLGAQAAGALATFVYSFALSYALAKLVDKTIGFRVSEEEELQGLDQTTHAETGYELTTLGSAGGAMAPTLKGKVTA
jgi:Amt family ammonium transporter